MKKLDLNKTLRTILLVLAIVLMIIKLFNKASAEGVEGIPSTARDYFVEVLDEAIGVIPSADLQSFNDYVNTCFQQPYIYCFKASYYSTIYDFFIFTPSSTFGTFGTYGHALSSRSNYAYATINDFPTYTISIQPGGIECITSTGIQYGAFSDSWNSLHWTKFSGRNLYTVVHQWGSTFYYNTTANGNPYDIKSNSDYFGQIIYSRSTDYGYSASWQEVEKFPVYTDTGFFNIWTSISQNDNKMLNITWDTSVFPSTGSMNYTKSVMDLTIEVNGTAQVVSFDSDENPELFPTSSGTYIPYKFLQKVADLAEVSPSDSFYLTLVSLTQYAYPAGAPSSSAAAYNETSLCSVDLGEIQVDVPAVTPVADIPISETNIVDTTFFTNIVGGSVSPAIDYPVPGWANHVQVAVGENPSAPYDLYLSWGYLEEISTQILSMDFSFGSGSSLVGASAELVTEYFKNLDYGALFQKLSQDYLLDYADIVTFDCYNLDSSNNAYIVKRIVIYTDSYFYKMQLQSLGSIQDMIQANTYYTKALYDYATVRFDGMAQSLEKLRISNNALLGSINANIINLQGLVSSGTDRIVNAIQGISGGGLSVSDLSGTLNTLFMPSFEWDTVNYQDYLDSLGVLALPFEFVFDTQSIIKNNYSSNIVLPINDFSVPLGKDFNDNDIQFTVFEDQENFEYNPTDIFPTAIWSVFQYLAAFGLVIGEAWFTYVHIFRKEEKSGDF